MRGWKRFLLGVLCVAVLAGGLAMAVSYGVYGRSLRASVYELRLRRRYATNRTAEEERQRLMDKLTAGEPTAALPENRVFRSEVSEAERDGLKVFTLEGGAGDGPLVLYLHGGAYINGFNAHQWRFMDDLAAASGGTVVAPAYHLAPFADYTRAYEDLPALWRALRAEHPGRRMILMGDSAGGGLALGLAEYLAAAGEPLPERLILFSPWVDVSMENPEIADYVPVDPILHLELVKVHGELWAGDGGTKHWQVSPLYGDMTGLPPVTIYCGTRELLYPDILLAAEKLRAAGVAVTLNVGRGLNHDYPLMPIPEGTRAVQEVCALVRGTD